MSTQTYKSKIAVILAAASPILRGAAQALAGVLASKGILTGEQESQAAEIFISILVFLVTLFWSYVEKRNIASVARVEGASESRTGPTGSTGPMPCIVLMLLAGLAVFAGVGCTPVGPKQSQSGEGGGVVSETPAINRSTWTDGSGTVHAEGGPGPTTVAAADADGVTFSKGGAPTSTAVWRAADGSQVTINADTNVEIEGVHLLAPDGTNIVKVDRFAINASEPQRALNEGIEKSMGYWVALTEAERDAFIRQMQAFETAGGQLGQFAGELVKTFVKP